MRTGCVLLGAEPYGFGPVSKAVAIAENLVRLGVECHFIGSGSALAFARENSHLFISVSDSSVLELAPSLPDRCNGVISVMEPSLALAAHKLGVPIVYVDSLSWMWDWSRDIDTLNEWLKGVSATAFGTVISELGSFNTHSQQYAAHAVADLVCVQRFESQDETPRLGPGNELIVGAIVGDTPPMSSTETYCLGSISGALNPLATPEQSERMSAALLRLMEEGAAAADLPVLFAGNASVLKRLGADHRETVELREHRGFRRAIRSADVFMASPGITSIAEAWAYSVPFVALPAQHYAHATILRRVNSWGAPAIPVADLSELSSGSALMEDVTGEIIFRMEQVASSSGDGWQKLVDHLAEVLRHTCSEREAVLAHQNSVCRQVFGSKTGRDEVTRVASELFGIGALQA